MKSCTKPLNGPATENMAFTNTAQAHNVLEISFIIKHPKNKVKG